MDKLLETLQAVERKYNHLNAEMEKPDFGTDIKKMTDLNKELKRITPIVEKYRVYQGHQNSLADFKEAVALGDKDFIELAKLDKDEADTQMPILYDELRVMLLPRDPMDDKDVIMEIRGAAGGDEANIFAGDLFKMYSIYAQINKWKIELLETMDAGSGGFTLVSFMVKGDDVYSKLKHENGIHRVQRVPRTESQGRIHTSTASVVVMPEIQFEEVQINKGDLRIDVYRSSGAGGQSVNTTDSAVRVTHIPTGTVSASQEGRSQHDNKDRAMKQLAAKLWEKQEEERMSKLGEARKSTGSGARSEKIRTYNYPQNRVTDHRIGLTLNKLDQVMQGKFDEIVIGLQANEQKEKMDEMEARQ